MAKKSEALRGRTSHDLTRGRGVAPTVWSRSRGIGRHRQAGFFWLKLLGAGLIARMVNGATGFGQRLNFIRKAVFSDCTDSILAAFTTALPAAGRAFLVVLAVTPKDVVKAYTEPKAKKGDKRSQRKQQKFYGRGKNGKPRARWRPSLPNTNALVAAILPGTRWFANRNPGPRERMFWFTWNKLEQVGLRLLLVSAADTFVYEWSSGIMERTFCADVLPHRVNGHSERPTIAIDGIWLDPAQAGVEHNDNFSIRQSGEVRALIDGLLVPMVGVAQMTASLTLKITQDFDATFSSRLWGEILLMKGDTIDAVASGKDIQIAGPLQEGQEIFSQVTVETGLNGHTGVIFRMRQDGASLWETGSGAPQQRYDYTCLGAPAAGA